MAKFSGAAAPQPRAGASVATSAISTTDERVFTHTGGLGFARGPLSDLFLLAVTNMVGEDTFHESATDRDKRFCDLIAKAVAEDPEWVARFVPYLRNTMQMRSASVVLACEYVRAGGPNGRRVIDAACARADEPAEVLGYWMANYGRRLPQPVKRGVADAAVRLYTERSALRYDGQSRQLRMGDVIELTHPRPATPTQGALFSYLLDARHHGDAAERLLARAGVDGMVERKGEDWVKEHWELPMLRSAAVLDNVPVDERRAVLRERGPQALAAAGYSWERLSGWLPGGMDAEAWEAIIPSMGVMALVRNLRNFDNAKISDAAIDAVIAKITSPEDVAAARLFPYQTWAAYREAPSDNWKRALGKTLDLTAPNVPALDHTLVLIDTSGSMQMPVSGRSKMARVEVAAVMAMTTWKRSSDVDVVIFGHDSARASFERGASVLAGVSEIVAAVGRVGHSTYGHTAMAAHFDPKRHRRVVMFTDDQQHDAGQVSVDHIPVIYTFNLAGYAPSSLRAGANGRFTLGGFTDATFLAIDALERGRDDGWPF